MNWYREWGITESLLLISFLFFYALYMFRTHRIASVLRIKTKTIWIKFGLRTFYFLLFLLALLGPSVSNAPKELKIEGKDIYLLVDLSSSMNAIDIAPSRIEKVKLELKKFCNSLSSNRIGLIIFSSEAFVQCPLTFDIDALSSVFITSLSPALMPSGSTDFAPALQMALHKHQTEEDAGSRSAKIVVLVSDGEDFGEETEELAQQIKDAKIRLFTVGVGTSEGGKIPLRNAYKRDKEGNEVITKLNAEPLKKLAEITKGRYFEISQHTNQMPLLLNSINAVEGDLKQMRKVDATDNKYYYVLCVALFLFILDILIAIRIFKI